MHVVFIQLSVDVGSPRLLTPSPFPLRDGVEFVLAALTESVSTHTGSPAQAPLPAPAPAPRLPVLLFLLGRQQEHHAAGHQGVPQRVDVVVVVLRLSQNVQAHADESTERPGQQVEDPALPRGRVTVTTAYTSVHLSTKQNQ